MYAAEYILSRNPTACRQSPELEEHITAIKSADRIPAVSLAGGYSVSLSADAFTFAGDTAREKSTQSFSAAIHGCCGSGQVTAAADTALISLPTGLTVASDGDTIAPTRSFTAAAALTQAILSTFGSKEDIPAVLGGGDRTLHKGAALSMALTGVQVRHRIP